jgi:phosphotransferase system  glucose/maltose/N-acetylglucosamine-specific IIC component
MAATAYPTANRNLWNLVAGFVAGFLGVLIFHQLMLGLLHLIGLTAGQPYAMRLIPPLGIPAFLSAAFWGGVWGIVFALVHHRFPRGTAYWVAAFLFGAIFPTLVAWFVVLPMKGVPAGNGWQPAGMLTGILVNGAWGIGTAFFLHRLPGVLRTSRRDI